MSLRTALILFLSIAVLGLIAFMLPWALQLLPEPIGSRALIFSDAARTTFVLTFLSGTIGLGVGLLFALGATLSWRNPLRAFASGLIGFLQGTPLLVQVLFVYYGVPLLVPGLSLGEFQSGVLALSLNVGAYNAEAIRAGIQAIPKGQTEAALSLGLSSAQKMRLIILPQALRMMIPPLVSNAVALLKDSSLVSAIGLMELTLAGNRISSETFQPVGVLLTVAMIYWIQTSLLQGVVRLLKD